MKVAAVQHDIAWADRDANFAALDARIAAASAEGARLVVLSEMFSTGFVVDRDDIGEPEGSLSASFLVRAARTHRVWVCGSCPETAPDDPRPYNSLVLAAPDGTVHRYRKIHRFTYGGEDRHFRPGADHLTVDIDGVRTSFFVCYDLRFADEFWGLARDTDLYVVPANWPESRREHWMALLRARAIENQAYVLGCNRVGEGGGLRYSGDSMIVDPLGQVMAQGGTEPCILVTNIDPDHVASTRAKFPFLDDRG